ncbi:N-substituted formamide deformylase precursor [Microbacterium azadirachtae]|uniref:N-substituted formamide deformylase n=1 Tax=Microbacterium azadirachtae TaxID=582680 RepID=A0A0F0KII9_9MICO|nr:amidohydrolase family protein [Microbacterium azadirachtae]KJL20697.1 N-substituted formamide deformylase precursor [Microbacterium azadirachtae]
MNGTPRGDEADLLLHGGRIRTFDAQGSVVDALAVRAGRIVATGRDALRLRAAQTLDLDGRTAIPGVNDAHLHAAWLGARWPHLFFSETPPHEQPSGRLVHTQEERRDALRRAWRLLAELGITSYTEPGIGPGEDEGETGCFGTAMMDAYLELHRAGSQTARVTLLRLFGELDGTADLAAFERGIRTPKPDTDLRWLAVTGVKIFADGIPPMSTAWVSAPYPDGTTGALLPRGADGALHAYRRMISLALECGEQVAVHATGDRSIEEFLRVLEDRPASGSAPHYVVHADLASAEQIARMRAVGAGFAVQPLIAEHTRAWAGAQLGPARAAAAWPLHEMIASGTLTTITSDAPIATPDWRVGLDASLALLDRDDAGTREQLLRRVTVDPARQDGADSWKGTLEVGKVADVAVLDEDPAEPGRAIAAIGISRTIVDGRTVFAADR